MNSDTYTDKSCYLYTTVMEREEIGGEGGGLGVGGEGLGKGGKVRWEIGGGDKVSLGQSITFLKTKI